MAKSTFVYVTYIRTTPEKLWSELIDVECMKQYWFGVHCESQWTAGSSWKMVYPDGRSEVVLSVPKYDFNWQTYYEFATPLQAPKGARLEGTAYYDNSAANPANPDPTAEVRWGDQR